jgi:hypothetical protein
MKNPKQKLKNILFLVIVLFTFSCSKDAYDENLNLDTRDYRFKKINFQELRNINNQAFIESAKLKKVLPADKHNTIESISGFDIDLQNIQYLKKTNNQETFSFRVLQSATATFSQNIVIDCKPNQSPQTYLVTYYLNKQLGQISTNDMFMNSITSTSTARLNSSSSNVSNTSGCLEVGYYEEEDYCEGNVDDSPQCYNSDGTRRKVLVFKVLASDCSTSGGEDFIPDVQEWMNNHQNSSNPSSGNESNGLGGGGENSSNTDIFIPNYFNSEDLSNPATQNMLQINQFIYNLYASDNAIKNVVDTTEWLLAYTNYWIGVNGGLSSSNQNALTYAFNNMPSVFYQYPDTINTQAQISLFQYKAFQFLLQHGAWLSGQSATTQQSILQNLTSLEKIEKMDELTDYIILNPSVSYAQYVNWFSLELPGIESLGAYDSTFWDNPNLNFPQQQLPSYATFIQNFPGQSVNAQQLCTNISGEILTLYNNIINSGNNINTCAIRLSKALNDSGIIIPYIPGKTKAGVSNGSNTKYYFTFAADLNKWMIKTFGTNSNLGLGPTNNNHVRIYYSHLSEFIDPINGNVLSPNNPLTNLQGIFSMVSSNPYWSTGHCDILQSNTTCINNCHFEGPIQYIDIWKLN